METREYVRLSSKALECMYVKSIIRAAVFAAAVIGLCALLDGVWPQWCRWIAIAFVVIQAVEALIAPKFKHYIYRYRLTDEELEVRKGFIFLHTEIIPVERLHKIEISAGPVFRAFGLNQVEVTTAGSDLKIDYLDREVADEIAQKLNTRINQIIIEERDEHEEREVGEEMHDGE